MFSTFIYQSLSSLPMWQGAFFKPVQSAQYGKYKFLSVIPVGASPAFSYAIILLFKSKSRIIISSLLLDTVASFFIV